MIKQNYKKNPQSPILLIIIGLIILSFWITACATLQNVPEYKNYSPNTSWNGNTN